MLFLIPVLVTVLSAETKYWMKAIQGNVQSFVARKAQRQEWAVAGHFIPALRQRALDAAGTPLAFFLLFGLGPQLWNGVIHIYSGSQKLLHGHA